MSHEVVVRYFVGSVCLLWPLALPLIASAQGGGEGASTELKSEEPTLTSEPAVGEPSLQLRLNDAGVGVVLPPPRTPDGYTLEKAERRVKRAKTGVGVSAGFFALGLGLAVVGSVCPIRNPAEEGAFTLAPPPGCTALLVTGALVNTAGLVGMIVSGVRLARRKRDRDSLTRAHPELRSSYRETSEVDTSDDAFFVVVTRKYEAGQLIEASVFIRHKRSGQYVNPTIDATEIDELDEAIRAHKAKLLRDAGELEVQP